MVRPRWKWPSLAEFPSLSLLGGLGVAEALQAIAEAALQRGGRVGVEGDQVPERLRFVFAQVRQRIGVGVWVTRDVFADGAVGMMREAMQSFGVGAGVFADEAEEVEVLVGSLLGELFEHFRLGFGAEDQANFFVPRGVDVVKFASAGVD